MRDRLLEDWLISAGERAYQVAFCASLLSEGQTLVHSTTHNALELGKDVIAKAADGSVRSYQLKACPMSTMTLSFFREHVHQQLNDLVMLHPVHPSLRRIRRYQPFLVVNADLHEHVVRDISDFNATLKRTRPDLQPLQTITKGELLRRFKDLGDAFWPTDLASIRTILEIYLTTGKRRFPSGKLDIALRPTLVLGERRRHSRQANAAAFSAAALITSSVAGSFEAAHNHGAIISAWSSNLAAVLADAERFSIPEAHWLQYAELAEARIYASLEQLAWEVDRDGIVLVGNRIADRFLHEVRVTEVLALLAVLLVMRRERSIPVGAIDEIARNCIREHARRSGLWGEAAAPQTFAIWLALSNIDGSVGPDKYLAGLITGITSLNGKPSKMGLADPYHGAEDLVPVICGAAPNEFDESFHGGSYSIEGFFHLLVRQNWKSTAKLLWEDVSRITRRSYEPRPVWQWYLHEAEKGTHHERVWPETDRWTALRKAASDVRAAGVPRLIRKRLGWYLLHILNYPQRMAAPGMRWAHEQASQLDWR